MSKNTPIFIGQCIVGNVRGDTFYKRVSASRHFLRKPHAIALDVQSLVDAEQAGAKKVAITDKESGNTYHASIKEIHQHSFIIERGYGKQYALTLNRWQCNDEPIQLNFLG
jgi:hypothetical protein